MNAVARKLSEAIKAYVQKHIGEIHLELLPQFVEAGDIAMVDYVFGKCPLKSKVESIFLAPLVIASRAGSLEMVELLLKYKHLPEVTAEMDTALYFAFHSGHKEIVRALIQAGANQSFFLDAGSSSYKSTFLIEAAGAGDLEMVKTLLELGADVNVVSDAVYESEPFSESDTALQTAVINGYPEIIRILLEAGADPNLNNPLFIAVYNEDEDLVRLLIKHRARIETPCGSGNDGRVESVLIHACRYGATEIVQLLMDEGADVNARDYQGDTALTDAAKFGHKEIVMALIGKGADVNAVSDEQCTSLTYALLLSRDEISAALLENGAERTLAERALQVPMIRRSLIHRLRAGCGDSFQSGYLPEYYGTFLCAKCDYKRRCEQEMS